MRGRRNRRERLVWRGRRTYGEHGKEEKLKGGIGRRVGSKEGHGSSVWYRERRMNCYEERLRERGGERKTEREDGEKARR